VLKQRASSGLPLVALWFFCGAPAGCLLYTDHINHAPTVAINGPSPVMFGDHPSYRGDGSDPDQSADSLSYEWRQRGGGQMACPKDLAEAQLGLAIGGERTFVEDADPTDDFCLWVVVRDDDGAAGYSIMAVSITHRDPEASVDIIKPSPTDDDHYPLYSTIQLSSQRSMDTETSDTALTRVFTVTHGGQTAAGMACPDGPEADICLTASEPGDYTIDLTVTDVRNHKAKARKKLTIDPDAPPCIRQTLPQFGLPKYVRDPNDLILAVEAVSDDGDPFPFVPPPGHSTQNLRFEWSWWLEGSPEAMVRPDYRHPEADFNGVFHVGDQVFIRLRVKDSVNRDRDFAACPPAMNCAFGKDDSCYQQVVWKFDLRLGREM
jgi:hypothetical protein